MTQSRSTALYPHPFSKAYWRDAAAELKNTKMLVITALLVALRIVLKPLAIPLGPQLSIQTAMLATALGAMIYGPVVAIPAAIVSDTIGFMIFPTGDYFLPYALIEIASTMIYALLLYRAKVSTVRVMLSRFCICFFLNVIAQRFVYAWQLAYMGNPEDAIKTITGIMTTTRIIKNLFFFPIETVVLTVFLKALTPVTRRAKLTFSNEEKLGFTPRQIAALVCLVVIGIGSATWYLFDRYSRTSRSADFSDKQRLQENSAAAELVLEMTDDWDSETVICVVDSAYRPLFGKETDYTVSVYILNEEAIAAGQAADEDESQSLIKVATVTYTQTKKTGEIAGFTLTLPTEESK